MIRSKRTMTHLNVNVMTSKELALGQYDKGKNIIFYATDFHIEAIRKFLMLSYDEANLFSRMICHAYDEQCISNIQAAEKDRAGSCSKMRYKKLAIKTDT